MGQQLDDTPNQSTDTSGVRAATERLLRRSAALAFLVMLGLVVLTSFMADRDTGLPIPGHWLPTVLFLLGGVPTVGVALKIILRHLDEVDGQLAERSSSLDVERRHRQLESEITDALEMAGNEVETLATIERMFGAVRTTGRTALLLADNSQAHLTVQAELVSEEDVLGCDVATPHDCPAARRARAHEFPDSTAVNACPKLAMRPGGPYSAACIPVSVMGRTVGVIHTVASAPTTIDPQEVRGLQLVGNQAGARIGMLRVMADTQLQAETDALTGLMNRRAFENRFRQIRNASPHGRAVLAMADLDHFKLINDTHGHDTGDRALRVFASTLRSAMRSVDLVARYGGEEFAMIFPDCDLDAATEILERVRERLDLEVRGASLPALTASFGITSAYLSEDLTSLLARADAALFDAKNGGRNRIVRYIARQDHEIAVDLSTP